MGTQDRRGALFLQVTNRGQRRPYAAVVGNAARNVEGNVEIHPHERPLVGNVDVPDRLLHRPDAPFICAAIDAICCRVSDPGFPASAASVRSISLRTTSADAPPNSAP